MLAFLGTKLGVYAIGGTVLLLVVGGGAFALRAESKTILELNQKIALLQVQSQSLQAANDAMRVDINNVQRAQQNAEHALSDVRVAAARAAQVVRSRTFATGTPAAIQIQINKDTSELFTHLEAISRAK